MIAFCVLCSIVFFGCEKPAPQFSNSGTLRLNGVSYSIIKSRFSVDSVRDEVYHAHLTFAPHAINISDAGISGGGGSYLYLSLLLPVDSLPLGVFSVDEGAVNSVQPYGSYLETISENKKDTTRTLIASGEMDYMLGGDTMPQFWLNFMTTASDSLAGSYLGTCVKNTEVDADSTGYVQVDTFSTALGTANMWQWGNLFSETLCYYELEILSSDTRFNDAGKMKNGMVLSLGFFSDNGVFPNDGVYRVAEVPENYTLFFGHKESNTYWGTYWQQLKNTSIISRANVTADSISICNVDGDQYVINIALKDQLGNRLRGDFKGGVNLRSPY